MRKLLRWLVLAPLAILLVLLAVANRAPVTLSLDPFSREAPAFSFRDSSNCVFWLLESHNTLSGTRVRMRIQHSKIRSSIFSGLLKAQKTKPFGGKPACSRDIGLAIAWPWSASQPITLSMSICCGVSTPWATTS